MKKQNIVISETTKNMECFAFSEIPEYKYLADGVLDGYGAADGKAEILKFYSY